MDLDRTYYREMTPAQVRDFAQRHILRKRGDERTYEPETELDSAQAKHERDMAETERWCDARKAEIEKDEEQRENDQYEWKMNRYLGDDWEERVERAEQQPHPMPVASGPTPIT